eukprot:Nk52_evm12s251 gene=Nk52_evmTU12s251
MILYAISFLALLAVAVHSHETSDEGFLLRQYERGERLPTRHMSMDYYDSYAWDDIPPSSFVYSTPRSLPHHYHMDYHASQNTVKSSRYRRQDGLGINQNVENNDVGKDNGDNEVDSSKANDEHGSSKNIDLEPREKLPEGNLLNSVCSIDREPQKKDQVHNVVEANFCAKDRDCCWVQALKQMRCFLPYKKDKQNYYPFQNFQFSNPYFELQEPTFSRVVPGRNVERPQGFGSLAWSPGVTNVGGIARGLFKRPKKNWCTRHDDFKPRSIGNDKERLSFKCSSFASPRAIVIEFYKYPNERRYRSYSKNWFVAAAPPLVPHSKPPIRMERKVPEIGERFAELSHIHETPIDIFVPIAVKISARYYQRSQVMSDGDLESVKQIVIRILMDDIRLYSFNPLNGRADTKTGPEKGNREIPLTVLWEHRRYMNIIERYKESDDGDHVVVALVVFRMEGKNHLNNFRREIDKQVSSKISESAKRLYTLCGNFLNEKADGFYFKITSEVYNTIRCSLSHAMEMGSAQMGDANCLIPLCINKYPTKSWDELTENVSKNSKACVFVHGKGERPISRYGLGRLVLLKYGTDHFQEFWESAVYAISHTFRYFAYNAAAQATCSYFGIYVYPSEDESYLNTKANLPLWFIAQGVWKGKGMLFAHSMGNLNLAMQHTCKSYKSYQRQFVPDVHDKYRDFLDIMCFDQTNWHQNFLKLPPTYEIPKDYEPENSFKWNDFAGPLLGSRAAAFMMKSLCNALEITVNGSLQRFAMDYVCCTSVVHLASHYYALHIISSFARNRLQSLTCGNRQHGSEKVAGFTIYRKLFSSIKEKNDVAVSIRECVAFFHSAICDGKTAYFEAPASHSQTGFYPGVGDPATAQKRVLDFVFQVTENYEPETPLHNCKTPKPSYCKESFGRSYEDWTSFTPFCELDKQEIFRETAS